MGVYILLKGLKDCILGQMFGFVFIFPTNIPVFNITNY